jgi:hypothetical protein
MKICLFSTLNDTAIDHKMIAQTVYENNGTIISLTHHPKERRTDIEIDGMSLEELNESEASGLDYDVVENFSGA